MSAHGSPCPYCQVRPDIACRHRPADETYRPPAQEAEKPDGRRSEARYIAGNLNGTRSFRNGKTGKMMRLRGRGD